jgi:3-dehydroquinate synthase
VKTAFSFGGFESVLKIQQALPSMEELTESAAGRGTNILAVCDEHTQPIVKEMAGGNEINRCTLKSGEASKNWDSVSEILRRAREAGLGRDGLIVGAGGGVICDMAAFAASIYMRGCGLCLVPTTLLAMVDASVGGKTGFDLFGVKNLAGTFYPASLIFMPLESLRTLPPEEWKSGMAELIKTAILEGGDFPDLVRSLGPEGKPVGSGCDGDVIFRCISRAALYKGRLVEKDPTETGAHRALLNLGHSFGHALESAAGLGRLSHGEAVAWGMVRSCELGLYLGITGRERAAEIVSLIKAFGYHTGAPHPLMGDGARFLEALGADKKKKGGEPVFIVPADEGARMVSGADFGAGGWEGPVKSIIYGEIRLD